MKLHSGCVAAGLLLFAVLACSLDKSGNTSNSNVNSPPGSDVKVLGTHTNRFKIVNKYVLVPKDLSTEKLTETATNLHRAEPEVNFWFVDDESKSAEMLQWVKAYEKGEATASDPIVDWMADHVVGNLQQYFGEGGTKYWALSKGMMGDRITKIE
jgi:hypothetical protein